MTADELTDDDIRRLEIEAELSDDLEWVRICLIAYRHGGRGSANPLARIRIARHISAGEAKAT